MFFSFLSFRLTNALILRYPLPRFLPRSISQTSGAESQAKAARVEQIQAELEDLKQQISTQGQQIDQYQHASNRAKEEKGKMR